MSEETDDGEPITTAVVEAIAEVEGCDPTDLEQLHGAIDTDALDALFDDGRIREGRLSFVYSGYEVTVTSDGVVGIDEPAT